MKLGFIGCSNITKAMMRSFISHNAVEAKDIIASDHDKYNLLRVKEDYGVVTTDSRKEVVNKARVLENLRAIRQQLTEIRQDL